MSLFFRVLLFPALLTHSRYDRVARKFRRAVPVWVSMSVAAGIAVGGFAWAANPKPPTVATAAFKTPTEAFALLTDSGRTMLSGSLGERCINLPVRVMILSTRDEGYDAVSMPTEECRLFRFTLAPEAGSVVPPDEVDIRSKTP